MLTQCPNCGTIYQLGATDLSAAHGYVECGACETQFNALERLADEPAFAPPPSTEPGTDTGPAFLLETADTPDTTTPPAPDLADESAPATAGVTGPVAAVPESIAATASAPSDRAPDVEPDTATHATVSVEVPAAPAADIEATTDPAPDEAPFLFDVDPDPDPLSLDITNDNPPSPDEADGAESMAVRDEQPLLELDDDVVAMAPLRPATTVLDESEHAILFTQPETATEEDEPDDVTEPIEFDDVPAVIKDEVAALTATRTGRPGWLWVLLALIFSALLAAQFAFMLRADIVAAAPELEPLFAAVCKKIQCAELRREPAAIELLSRDVRDHPQYRDTLLVNATLVSRAAAPVPFPVIQLGLQGPAGKVLGVRRFEPSEYLDKSIDLDAGMPPNRAVYIVLEVAQIGNRAASFEFTFL